MLAEGTDVPRIEESMDAPEPLGRVDPNPPAAGRARRLLLAGIGVLLVGVGAVGAVLPGLPTTIFLIGASWCFARSCPWLEEKLLNTRLFRPFHGWLRADGRVSPRTKAGSIIAMWIAITISAALLMRGTPPRIGLASAIVALGFVGTWFIVRHGRSREGAAAKRSGRGA
jgi:uncharacterized protein